MNKMLFDNKDIYVIEVAKGQIAIDLSDTHYLDRIEALQSVYEKGYKKYQNAIKVIENKNDLTLTKNKITAKDRALINTTNTFIKETSQALNEMFGKGAVDKIFYDELFNETRVTIVRLITLFEDLLPPHFKKAGVQTKAIVDEMLKPENFEKYLDDETETLKVED
jgi:hypothetical protein